MRPTCAAASAVPAFIALTGFSAFLLPAHAWAQDTPQTPPPAGQPTPNPPPPGTPGPERSRKPFRIGPEVGVYLPTSGKTRDTFGSAWFNYGLGLGTIPAPNGRGSVTFNLSFFSASRNGNQLFMAPIGVGYRVGLARKRDSNTSQTPDDQQNKGFLPYVGASANLVFAYLKSDTYNIRSGVRTTEGGSVFVGANFGEKAYAQVRYLATGRASGFDLSGTSITAGLRF